MTIAGVRQNWGSTRAGFDFTFVRLTGANQMSGESAMSDKINEQTEKMREMAQTTLDKAKDAMSKYMAESQKLREKADVNVRATYSTAKEMNEKAVAFAEANVRAGFELAERLLQAKNPQEMGAVYQSHLKEQMEKMNAQFREVGNLMSKPAPVDLNK
jgi:hypothetical protein